MALNEISQSSIFVTAGNCLICLFILFTICGDALIYTAFLSNNNLKTRTNAFFLSLVTTDILMAVFVMPMEIVLLSSWKNRLQNFEFSVCGSWKRVCLSRTCHWCRPFLGNFTSFAILQLHFILCHRFLGLPLGLCQSSYARNLPLTFAKVTTLFL